MASLDGLRQRVAAADSSRTAHAQAGMAEVESLVAQVAPLDAELDRANGVKDGLMAQVATAKAGIRGIIARRDPLARELDGKIRALGEYLGPPPIGVSGG